jgi:hypothetical protein
VKVAGDWPWSPVTFEMAPLLPQLIARLPTYKSRPAGSVGPPSNSLASDCAPQSGTRNRSSPPRISCPEGGQHVKARNDLAERRQAIIQRDGYGRPRAGREPVRRDPLSSSAHGSCDRTASATLAWKCFCPELTIVTHGQPRHSATEWVVSGVEDAREAGRDTLRRDPQQPQAAAKAADTYLRPSRTASQSQQLLQSRQSSDKQRSRS